MDKLILAGCAAAFFLSSGCVVMEAKKEKEKRIYTQEEVDYLMDYEHSVHLNPAYR